MSINERVVKYLSTLTVTAHVTEFPYNFVYIPGVRPNLSKKLGACFKNKK